MTRPAFAEITTAKAAVHARKGLLSGRAKRAAGPDNSVLRSGRGNVHTQLSAPLLDSPKV